MNETNFWIAKVIGAILISVVLWWIKTGQGVMALWFFIASLGGILLLVLPKK
jgi:hypothetical protein